MIRLLLHVAMIFVITVLVTLYSKTWLSTHFQCCIPFLLEYEEPRISKGIEQCIQQLGSKSRPEALQKAVMCWAELCQAWACQDVKPSPLLGLVEDKASSCSGYFSESFIRVVRRCQRLSAR